MQLGSPLSSSALTLDKSCVTFPNCSLISKTK